MLIFDAVALKKCLDIWWVRIKAVILQPFSRLAQARATRRLENGNADKHWKSASYKENAEKNDWKFGQSKQKQ